MDERMDTEAEDGAVLEGMDAIAVADPPAPAQETGALEGMMNLRMEVQVLLGRVRMPVADLVRLGPGALLDLDRTIGAPVDVVVGEQLIARGTLVQTAEDRVGVSLTEILRDPAPSA